MCLIRIYIPFLKVSIFQGKNKISGGILYGLDLAVQIRSASYFLFIFIFCNKRKKKDRKGNLTSLNKAISGPAAPAVLTCCVGWWGLGWWWWCGSSRKTIICLVTRLKWAQSPHAVSLGVEGRPVAGWIYEAHLSHDDVADHFW